MPFYRFILSQALNILYTLVCVVALALSPSIVFANESLATAKPSDIRMVIDISGSMKKNDPLNLRAPAVDMLVKLLPKGSKAGIWSFGTKVNTLVPHKKVNAQWSKKATTAAKKINAVAQFTNIGAALEQAVYDAGQLTGDYQKHVILLTDGMVDISRDVESNQKERQRIIDHILPLYQRTGFTLHTIALSNSADQHLLNKLAVETDGRAVTAKTADELMSALLSVFDQAAPAEQAPFDGERFVVDSSIEDFTALIFRKQGSADVKITAPDGTVYNKNQTDQYVNWYHADTYDLITAQKPLEGEWLVDAEVEPQSRITVVSDLQLFIAPMPRNIMVGDTVETTVAFQQDKKIVTRVEFLGLLDIDRVLFAPDGSEHSQRISKNLVPVDGIYPVSIDHFDQEGEYIIDFVVDGKSFSRQLSHIVSVRKPLSVEVNDVGKAGVSEFLIQVIPQIRSIDVKQSDITASLTLPGASQKAIPFSLTADGRWETRIALQKSGNHQLSFSTTIIDNNGDVINASLTPLVLSTESLPQAKKPDASISPTEPAAKSSVGEALEDNPVLEGQQQAAEEKSGVMKYLLYAVIGLMNILIIVITFIIYRKLFKKKSAEPIPDEVGTEAELDLSEPPMDEMAVEEMDDEFISEPEPSDMAPVEATAEEEEQTPSEEDAPVEEVNSEENTDDNDIDADSGDPGFSLDDFALDSLEDEDISNFERKKEE